MIDPSQFLDLGDWAPIHRKKLMEIVAKTPLEMKDFERLLGCDFIRDAPQKKKELGWELLQLGKDNLKFISELRKAFPNAYVTEIRDVSHAAVHDELGAPRPDVGT